jgi:hypothetical protein
LAKGNFTQTATQNLFFEKFLQLKGVMLLKKKQLGSKRDLHSFEDEMSDESILIGLRNSEDSLCKQSHYISCI